MWVFLSVIVFWLHSYSDQFLLSSSSPNPHKSKFISFKYLSLEANFNFFFHKTRRWRGAISKDDESSDGICRKKTEWRLLFPMASGQWPMDFRAGPRTLLFYFTWWPCCAAHLTSRPAQWRWFIGQWSAQFCWLQVSAAETGCPSQGSFWLLVSRFSKISFTSTEALMNFEYLAEMQKGSNWVCENSQIHNKPQLAVHDM